MYNYFVGGLEDVWRVRAKIEQAGLIVPRIVKAYFGGNSSSGLANTLT